MSPSRGRTVSTLCLLASLAAGAALADTADFWRDFSGDLPSESFGLKLAWERELGSGYSHVTVADGKVVTLFTSGDTDVAAAFDLESGDELWRYDFGDKYVGHTGSSDGPLSTPAIAGDRVFALGPFGRLVALGLADGSVKWRRDLTEEDSSKPFYGYTTSPIVVGDRVILATGGAGHAITAFDTVTGEPVWSAGDDDVSYQTPVLLEVEGRTLLIAPTNQFVQALDPASGEVLWRLQHAEGERRVEGAHAIPAGDGRFLLWLDNASKLYRASTEGAEELWTTNALANSLAVPVRVGDHFYGFTGAFLTCVDVETGEIVWRSRPPAGQGISVIDGVLASLGRNGDLVLVEASPEGYREVTRLPVLERGEYASPSFADGVFVVRNLERMAGVRVDTATAPRLAEVDRSDRIKGALGAWIESVEALAEAERQAAVEARFATIESAPITEENGVTHFVWRGDAEDVGVGGDVAPNGEELGLFRLAGTDLFFRSLELDPKAQYTYRFTVDYGDPSPDPMNPLSVDLGFASVSELRMPAWPAAPHIEPPAEDAPRGTLDGFPFHSEILGNTRELKVWRPHGYGNPEVRYPVLIVNHGDNLLRGGLMQNTLDNLVGESVAPLVAVFVPRTEPAEYGGEKADDYTRFLLEELLPHIDRHYLTDGENRAIMGPGSAGVAALYASFKHPDVFQRAAVQSYYPISPAQDRIPEMIAAAGPKPELVYTVWSRHDYDLGDGRRSDDATAELLAQLRAAGVNEVEQVADYSPGWAGWRGQDDEILATFFPLEPTDD